MSRRIPRITAALVCALFLSGAACSLWMRHSRPRHPNIVFLTFDSLRADHMSCYGYARKTTPALEEFSRNAIRFTQAITQSSYTAASLSSVLTSRYPDHRTKEIGYVLSDDNQHLVKILKRHGYRCAFFSNNTPTLNICLHDIKPAFEEYLNDRLSTASLIDRAIAWRAQKKDSPYFLWISVSEPHAPYTPAPAYYEEFLSDQLAVHSHCPISQGDPGKDMSQSMKKIPSHVAEEGITDTAYYIAKYDGEIRYADEQFGRLLKYLDSAGPPEETLIVIFSDHGESMAEHDLYFSHIHFLYEEHLRVPLMMRLPGKRPLEKTITAQVQLVDILPTVLKAAGIRPPEGIAGKNLLGLIKGTRKNGCGYAFSENAYWPAPRSIRSQRWKLLHNRQADTLELYDLLNDPKELKNVLAEYPREAARLKARLTEWADHAATHRIATQSLSKEQQELITSLGYVQ